MEFMEHLFREQPTGVKRVKFLKSECSEVNKTEVNGLLPF